MDWTSIIVAVAIAFYGWLEYRRRETAHRSVLARLMRGASLPVSEAAPPLAKILMLGSVCLLLLFTVAILLYFSSVVRTNAGKPLGIMAFILISPLAILVLMFIRDLRLYRTRHASRWER